MTTTTTKVEAEEEKPLRQMELQVRFVADFETEEEQSAFKDYVANHLVRLTNLYTPYSGEVVSQKITPVPNSEDEADSETD